MIKFTFVPSRLAEKPIAKVEVAEQVLEVLSIT